MQHCGYRQHGRRGRRARLQRPRSAVVGLYVHPNHRRDCLVNNGLAQCSPIRAAEPSSKLLLVGCLTSQQHASISQGRICSDNFTCCHTETEVADPTFHLTQSRYTDTGPTSPSADPITPGAWQGSHWSANFL